MRKQAAAFILALLLLPPLAGCAPAQAQEELFAMDTVMSLTAYGAAGETGLEAAKAEIRRLDSLLSVSGGASEIRRVNEAGGGTVSEETAALLERAAAISRACGGAFDVTVGPVVDVWGFYGDEQRVPSADELAAALALVGPDKLTLAGTEVRFAAAGVRLDLGGVAKGYAAGRAAEALKAAGVASAIMTLGGNVRTVGLKPDGSRWKVGIADPAAPQAMAGVLTTGENAVVTSGGYQRYFDEDGVRYHHIIDPATGYPAASGILSATVVTADDVLADALSTALFVLGEEQAGALWRSMGGFEMILIAEGGRIIVTGGLADDFSPADGYTVEVLS